MRFLENFGAKSASWTGKNYTGKETTFKKAIILSLLTAILLSAAIAGCAAADVKLAGQAFDVAVLLPGRVISAQSGSAVEASVTEPVRQTHELNVTPPGSLNAQAPPGNAISTPRRSNIEEVADVTVSSIKGITELMRQAHELSAMLPTSQSNRACKTNA